MQNDHNVSLALPLPDVKCTICFKRMICSGFLDAFSAGGRELTANCRKYRNARRYRVLISYLDR